jgi:glucose/arabinose dehydrogenase
VHDGAFYGWPYSYFGPHVDARVNPPQPQQVAAASVPDYALGAHVAALGLAFAHADQLPGPLAQGGALIGEHGSWNRQPLSGYKLVFVPFSAGRPSGPPVDVLSGFINADGQAQGRPVGVAITAQQAVLVADDVGNTIWRLTGAP